MNGHTPRLLAGLLLFAAIAPIAVSSGTVLAQPVVPGSAAVGRTIVAIPGSLLLPPFGSVTFSAGGTSADLFSSPSLEVDSDTPEPVTASYVASGPSGGGGSQPGVLTLTAPAGAAVWIGSGCQPDAPPANTVRCAVTAMPFEGSAFSPNVRSRIGFMTMAEGASLPPGACPLPIPPYNNSPPPGPFTPGEPGVPVCDARYLGTSLVGFCKPPLSLRPRAEPSAQEYRKRAPGSACLFGSGSVTFYPADAPLPGDDEGPPDDSAPHLTVASQGALFTTVIYDDQGLTIATSGGSVVVTSDSGCVPTEEGFSVVTCPDVTLDPPSTVTFFTDTESSQRPGRVTDAPGWNLIGGLPGTILLGDDGPLYTLDSDDPTAGYAALPSRTPFEGGTGYWAYFDGTTQSPFPSVPPQPFQIQILPGRWLLIGNPLSVQATVDGADSIEIYDPVTAGYRQTTVLYPGQGAWAYSAAGGLITFTPVGP